MQCYFPGRRSLIKDSRIAKITLIFLAIPLSGCGLLSESEPTDDELVAAVRQHYESAIGDGTIRNPINNVHMNLKEVRKLGCERAKEGSGYFCSYTTRMSLGASSNETSSDGIAHAQAANMLLKAMTGGDHGLVDRNTHRFVRNWDNWELVE